MNMIYQFAEIAIEPRYGIRIEVDNPGRMAAPVSEVITPTRGNRAYLVET